LGGLAIFWAAAAARHCSHIVDWVAVDHVDLLWFAAAGSTAAAAASVVVVVTAATTAAAGSRVAA